MPIGSGAAWEEAVRAKPKRGGRRALRVAVSSPIAVNTKFDEKNQQFQQTIPQGEPMQYNERSARPLVSHPIQQIEKQVELKTAIRAEAKAILARVDAACDQEEEKDEPMRAIERFGKFGLDVVRADSLAAARAVLDDKEELADQMRDLLAEASQPSWSDEAYEKRQRWLAVATARASEVAPWFPQSIEKKSKNDDSLLYELKEAPASPEEKLPPLPSNAIIETNTNALAQAQKKLSMVIDKARTDLSRQSWAIDLKKRLNEYQVQVEKQSQELFEAQSHVQTLEARLKALSISEREARNRAEALGTIGQSRENKWNTTVDEYETCIEKLDAESTDLKIRLRLAEQVLRERQLEIHLIRGSNSSVEVDRLKSKLASIERQIKERDTKIKYLKRTMDMDPAGSAIRSLAASEKQRADDLHRQLDKMDIEHAQAIEALEDEHSKALKKKQDAHEQVMCKCITLEESTTMLKKQLDNANSQKLAAEKLAQKAEQRLHRDKALELGKESTTNKTQQQSLSIAPDQSSQIDEIQSNDKIETNPMDEQTVPPMITSSNPGDDVATVDEASINEAATQNFEEDDSSNTVSPDESKLSVKYDSDYATSIFQARHWEAAAAAATAEAAKSFLKNIQTKAALESFLTTRRTESTKDKEDKVNINSASNKTKSIELTSIVHVKDVETQTAADAHTLASKIEELESVIAKLREQLHIKDLEGHRAEKRHEARFNGMRQDYEQRLQEVETIKRTANIDVQRAMATAEARRKELSAISDREQTLVQKIADMTSEGQLDLPKLTHALQETIRSYDVKTSERVQQAEESYGRTLRRRSNLQILGQMRMRRASLCLLSKNALTSGDGVDDGEAQRTKEKLRYAQIRKALVIAGKEALARQMMGVPSSTDREATDPMRINQELIVDSGPERTPEATMVQNESLVEECTQQALKESQTAPTSTEENVVQQSDQRIANSLQVDNAPLVNESPSDEDRTQQVLKDSQNVPISKEENVVQQCEQRIAKSLQSGGAPLVDKPLSDEYSNQQALLETSQMAPTCMEENLVQQPIQRMTKFPHDDAPLVNISPSDTGPAPLPSSSQTRQPSASEHEENPSRNVDRKNHDVSLVVMETKTTHQTAVKPRKEATSDYIRKRQPEIVEPSKAIMPNEHQNSSKVNEATRSVTDAGVFEAELDFTRQKSLSKADEDVTMTATKSKELATAKPFSSHENKKVIGETVKITEACAPEEAETETAEATKNETYEEQPTKDANKERRPSVRFSFDDSLPVTGTTLKRSELSAQRNANVENDPSKRTRLNSASSLSDMSTDSSIYDSMKRDFSISSILDDSFIEDRPVLDGEVSQRQRRQSEAGGPTAAENSSISIYSGRPEALQDDDDVRLVWDDALAEILGQYPIISSLIDLYLEAAKEEDNDRMEEIIDELASTELHDISAVLARIRDARWLARANKRVLKSAVAKSLIDAEGGRNDKRGTWLPQRPPARNDGQREALLVNALGRMQLEELQGHSNYIRTELLQVSRRTYLPKEELSREVRIHAHQWWALRDAVEANGGWAQAISLKDTVDAKPDMDIDLSIWPVDEREKMLKLQIEHLSAVSASLNSKVLKLQLLEDARKKSSPPASIKNTDKQTNQASITNTVGILTLADLKQLHQASLKSVSIAMGAIETLRSKPSIQADLALHVSALEDSGNCTKHISIENSASLMKVMNDFTEALATCLAFLADKSNTIHADIQPTVLKANTLLDVPGLSQDKTNILEEEVKQARAYILSQASDVEDLKSQVQNLLSQVHGLNKERSRLVKEQDERLSALCGLQEKLSCTTGTARTYIDEKQNVADTEKPAFPVHQEMMNEKGSSDHFDGSKSTTKPLIHSGVSQIIPSTIAPLADKHCDDRHYHGKKLLDTRARQVLEKEQTVLGRDLLQVMRRLGEIDSQNENLFLRIQQSQQWVYHNPQVVFNGKAYESIVEWAKEQKLRKDERQKQIDAPSTVFPGALLDLLPPIAHASRMDKSAAESSDARAAYVQPGTLGKLSNEKSAKFVYCHAPDVEKRADPVYMDGSYNGYTIRYDPLSSSTGVMLKNTGNSPADTFSVNRLYYAEDKRHDYRWGSHLGEIIKDDDVSAYSLTSNRTQKSQASKIVRPQWYTKPALSSQEEFNPTECNLIRVDTQTQKASKVPHARSLSKRGLSFETLPMSTVSKKNLVPTEELSLDLSLRNGRLPETATYQAQVPAFIKPRGYLQTRKGGERESRRVQTTDVNDTVLFSSSLSSKL